MSIKKRVSGRPRLAWGYALSAWTLALVLASPAGASPPDWRSNRLILPEKVTVGPADNYQARLDRDARRLIYTQHQHLLSGIVIQDLVSGLARSLLPPDHDAKDPALSPDGTRIAFTSFHNNALGGICLQRIDGPLDVRCLTRPGTRAWGPVWFDDDRLGYLRSATGGRAAELVVHSMSGGNPEILLQGDISAPSVSADGRFLVFNRRTNVDDASLYIRDLQTGEEHGPLLFDLPGLSSFAVIDQADGHLYFSHYPTDTSGDQRIDAEDHSVIYRMPMREALSTRNPLLPEPLTSVAHNCSFPALGEAQLYLTCAYEGSLDIYRLPLTGQVPLHWGESELGEAHSSASRYEDRLFVLHTVRYRGLACCTQVRERLLANHLEMQEYTAARYYISQLEQLHRQSGDADQADFYGNFRVLVEQEAAFRLQPQGARTARFRQQVEQARAALQPAPQHASTQLFQAWLDWFSLQPARAAQRLQDAQPSPYPLGRYIELQLRQRLLAGEPAALKRLFLDAADDPVISSDARLFHANEYLKRLLRERPGVEEHLAELESARSGLRDARVRDLLANEMDLLRLADTRDLVEERELYGFVSERLARHASEPMMHRVGHVRAIQLMGLAERYDYMELVSRHWLTHTPIRHVSFAPTAAQYAVINLNQGYGAWSLGDDNSAINSFYSVIRQTSDLESLYNLLVIGLDPDTDPAVAERMDQLYQQLEREALLGNSHRFADAVRLLVKPEPGRSNLEQAAGLLVGLEPEGLDTGVADLLLGSLYHRQFLESQDGYRFDRGLYQQAHHRYMLALDLGHANVRVQAALLENLGRLHFEVRNYGVSAEFWGQRLLLPVVRPEDAVWHHWQHARALFYSNRPADAYASALEALRLGEELGTGDLPALRDRAAFYALDAGLHEQAARHYESALQSGELTWKNRLKAEFSRAYAHFKLGSTEAARSAFEQVLASLPQAAPRDPSPVRLAPFEPKRLELQAYGFMAQLAADAAQRQFWLRQRIALLEGMGGRTRNYGFSEQSRLEMLVRARLQYAASLEQAGQHSDLSRVMNAVLDDLRGFLDAGGSPNSQPVLHGLYNYLTLASYHPQAFAQEPRPLRELIARTLEELQVEGYTPPVNQGHWFKLQLLDSFHAARARDPQAVAGLAQRIRKLESDPAWQALERTRPDWLAELEELAAGIRAFVDASPGA